MNPEQLNQAIAALKTYDWGTDPKVLKPIDDAILTSHGDAAARKDLESRLIEVLKSEAPRAAKDTVCRMLMTIGTAASVPALAALLPDEKLSHMARYALERIQEPESAQALREALPKAGGKLKLGIIGSLGARGDAKAVPDLQALLGDGDPAVTWAAARALGSIGTPEANRALVAGKPCEATKAALAEALLGHARKQLTAGQKQEAKATYQRILAGDPSAAVKHAASVGLQDCSR